MQTVLGGDLLWWITIIDIPAMSGLFWMIWRTKKEAEAAVRQAHETQEMRSTQLREALSSFKLEVAKTYASTTDIKDLETRIVSHLLRIESKLDKTALKTQSLLSDKA
jgi:hypothetical protein